VINKVVVIGSLVVIGAGLGLVAYVDSRPATASEARAAVREPMETPLILLLPEITIVGDVPAAKTTLADEGSQSSASIPRQ
jgi:hypothetical protein